MEHRTLVENCEIVSIPKVSDRRGNLSVVQHGDEFPFEVQRVFYIYDIPSGKSRGEHAHYECHQLLIATSGSFCVRLDDGADTKTVELRRPNQGLHIPPGIWAGERDFSGGAVCLVLASHSYDEDDYIRDYGTFLDYAEKQ